MSVRKQEVITALQRLVDQMEMVLYMNLIDPKKYPTSVTETLAAMTEAWTALGLTEDEIQDHLKLIDEIANPPPPLTRYQFRPTNPEPPQ